MNAPLVSYKYIFTFYKTNLEKGGDSLLLQGASIYMEWSFLIYQAVSTNLKGDGMGNLFTPYTGPSTFYILSWTLPVHYIQ